MTSKKPAPLLGYNTNVRHEGNLFHIQTEDSGIDHPHIITHLFVEGTILATKKSSYVELLTNSQWEEEVRKLMKDQHRAMFVELREGIHDSIAEKVFGPSFCKKKPDTSLSDCQQTDDISVDGDIKVSSVSKAVSSVKQQDAVKIIRPAAMTDKKLPDKTRESKVFRGKTIFDTPEDDGEFGENLITDKSLDEVILSYLTDELEE